MKKLTILFSILIASISANAASTLQITLSSASQGNKVLQIVVDNPFSDAYDNGYDATIGANQPGGLYICSGSERYSFWATNALATRLPMGFGSVADDSYTMTFQYFTGTPFVIYDRTAKKTITVNSASNILINGEAASPANKYTFTLGDGENHNAAINDRFVINPKYDVTLNANGLATFSAIDAVSIPDGLTAYTATGLNGDVLGLAEITADQVPANTGVILYGAANGAYELPIIATATAITETNLLKAATVWPAESGTVYILHGSELWEYTGSDMKANKAYLQLPAGAPKRIRLAFDQATAIDAVEAEVVKAEKFVENGQIFIRRGNEVFNLQGQLVR